jgi:hypothetical protein
MIIAMLLAHLVGDYVLQWDGLANWKSREYQGVLVHGGLVTLVTLVFALALDTHWWTWAVLIGGLHTIIDGGWLWFNRRFTPRSGLFPLFRLFVDQLLHLSVIVWALLASGVLVPGNALGEIAVTLRAHRWLVIVLGYVFVTMPAWILLEFTLYALVNGSPPDFACANRNKYVGSLERGLITTFVLLGQFALVPLVMLPRLVFDSPHVIGNHRATLYIAEWLGSLAVAVLIGLGLRQL